jgi:PRTRC genetic system protein B
LRRIHDLTSSASVKLYPCLRMFADMIAEYERAFFDSNFTHPNDPRGMIKYRDDAIAFWRHMLDGLYPDAFPQRVLAPLGCTLAGLIKRLEKNDGRG